VMHPFGFRHTLPTKNLFRIAFWLFHLSHWPVVLPDVSLRFDPKYLACYLEIPQSSLYCLGIVDHYRTGCPDLVAFAVWILTKLYHIHNYRLSSPWHTMQKALPLIGVLPSLSNGRICISRLF